jgi:SAM-dependent methyltransferase
MTGPAALMLAGRPLPRIEAGGGIVTVSDEAQARALFQERYRTTPSLLARRIEQRVIGGDWGANGFTTMAQADTLARELHLSAADRLLDLGSGRGWPGLYLAARTGCRVVLTDLPLEGLRVAANRAAAEGLAARTGVVAAAASGLPFRAGSFDVVIHTDVLC